MTMKLILLIIAVFLVALSHGGAAELTPDSFNEALSGKNLFVKFFAPWCGHCKALKPTWDQLADEFSGSSSIVVGDVDCTADGKDLCDQFEVRGYPTLKYFKDGDKKGEDYQSGRDFESLKKFVEDELEVKCDINDTSLCTDKEKGYIEKMKIKTSDERKAEIERLSKMKGDSMKVDLKQWLNQRLNILRGLDSQEQEL